MYKLNEVKKSLDTEVMSKNKYITQSTPDTCTVCKSFNHLSVDRAGFYMD